MSKSKKTAEPSPLEDQPVVALESKPRKAAKSVKTKAEPVVESLPEAAAEKAAPAKKAPAKKSPAKKAAATKTAAKKLPAKKAGVSKVTAEDPAPPLISSPIAQPVLPEPIAEEPPAKKVSAKASAKKSKAAPAEAASATVAADDEPAASGPPPNLERLQKILARAGVSSRRKAEELILGGLVQINGKVVTELGTKADMARDHVRVDGKLLQGPERIRYFVLNKPKGFVTTVSDPEGRPTVMQFFERESERLYPVGRLDYLSEGLLLITNDGDLANKLTKASSGVEKTYLVKVAGQPTEDMLDVLRAGVVIEKGRPGTNSGRVRTAPARIRQVRQGDNPWYEVIIIEGRNRELRKMFEEIGHHVEKIRRVGYGPLVLDQEPGKLRELEPEEVQQLRLAADGKLKTRRRRGPAEAQLPTVAGKTVRYKKADGRPGYEKPSFAKPDGFQRAPAAPSAATSDRPRFQKPGQGKPAFDQPRFSKPAFKPGFAKPAFERPDSESPASRGPAPDRASFSKPGFNKPSFNKPGFSKPSFGAADPRGRSRQSGPPEPPVTDYVVPRRPDLAFDDSDSGAPGAFNPDYKPGFRTGGKPSGRPSAAGGRSDSRPAFKPSADRGGFTPKPGGKPFAKPSRPTPPDSDYPDSEPRTGIRISVEPVDDKPRSARPDRSDRPARPAGRSFAKPFSKPYQQRSEGGFSGGRSTGSRPPSGDRPFRPRPDGVGQGRPGSPRPAPDGLPSGERPFRPRTFSKPFSQSSDTRSARPTSDRPAPGSRPFRPRPSADGDAPREFRPRPSGPSRGTSRPAGSFDGAKKFGGPKRFGATSYGTKNYDKPKPAPGGSNSKPSGKLGPDGLPRVKVRARNSFTGKNKGRPKPKPKSEE